MISYLEGKVIKKAEKHIVLLVGGVGYKVFAGGSYLSEIEEDDELGIFTYLNVKEDSLALYGFKTESELELFELLITISGVGPKAALGILALDSPEKIAGAIASEDVGYLGSVSGIGKKTAQKIVIELKDKVASLSFNLESSEASIDNEVVDALEALGFNTRKAREALKNIPKEIEKVEDKIREALKILGK